MSVPEIPVGTVFEDIVNWCTDHLGPLFDAIGAVIEFLVGSGPSENGLIGDILTTLPVVLMAVVLGLIGWAVRGRWFGLFTLLGFVLVQGMRLWPEAMSTLALVLVASAIAVAIGIPIGIGAAASRRMSTVVRPVLDFMQTMPAFVYLLPAIFFFGIGKTTGVVATVVFAMPPGVRLTELGIRQVDREMVEAGEAFGTSPFRILTRIQIPLALQTIMAGINQVIMLSLSMVVIAGIVGAGGLGGVVFEAIGRVNVGQGFEGGLAVVIIAIFLDRVTAGLGSGEGVFGGLAERLRGLRKRGGPGPEPGAAEADEQELAGSGSRR